VRIVLDTNTLVSAIGWDGPPRRVLLATVAGRHHLTTTPDLLNELVAVLRYRKLQPVAAHPLLPTVLAWLHRPEHIVLPSARLRVIQDDPADNIVLEAALAGGADVIVSGDRHLLALREFQGIRILTARQFVARYARSEEEG